MSNAVIPRQQGDEYQANFFWMHACNLYRPHTKVHKVEWEADSSEGFDDVVVHYSPPVLDSGDNIIVEKYQVKFHVDHQRSFNCESLIDPSFIGTKVQTILSRLFNLYKSNPEQSRNARFYMINTWGIDNTDQLRFLIGNGGAIILARLFDGSTERSVNGKIRKMWKDHLGITSDDILKEVLRPLRIQPNYADLTGQIKFLNLSLELAGLKPIEADRRTSGYTELIQKLHGEGKKSFTKDELFEICQREGFVISKTEAEAEEEHYVIGIRSFTMGAEMLESQVDDLVCLLHYFSGRFMIEDSSWENVLPVLEDAAARGLKSKKLILIHLDTHLSIAFCFGFCLDFKYGTNVSIIQKTMSGRITWKPELDQLGIIASDVWNFAESPTGSDGQDLVIAISITHNIYNDVLHYATVHCKTAGRIIHASIKPSPSNTSVSNANHVVVAVQEFVRQIRSVRTPEEKMGRIHLFMAAPNAFAFFLGQQSKPLGKITLYEFDFENNKTGSYQPVISLPINNKI